MQVLIIRHAIAVPRGTPGIADDQRPLTEEGERRFRKAAKGLAKIAATPQHVWTSPLPRALRTAELACAAWNAAKPPKQTRALVDAKPKELQRLLEKQRTAKCIALVGHEPSLSALIAHWLGADDAERFALRKGAAVLLDMDEDLAAGTLIWSLTPKLLRALS